MTSEHLMRLLTGMNHPNPTQVWGKAHYAGAENERQGYRKDDLGNWIQHEHYGRRSSDYGWEIDHIVPSSSGGSDLLSNLRPLHWRANVAKSDNASPLEALARLLANDR